MEKDNSTTLYFYPSQVKNVLFVITFLVFIVGGIAICDTAFKNEDYLMVLLGGFIAIFFTIPIPIFIKNIIKPVPYLALTEKELIMNPSGKKPAHIKWVDIERYQIKSFRIKFNTLTFIEIILYDEEKYKKQLSKINRKFNAIGTMGGTFSLFTIRLEQIKVTERDLFLYALDNITSPDFNVKDVPKSKITKKMESFTNQINLQYFWKNYLLSLIIAISFMVILYEGEKNINSLNYLITSFVLFPFAKLMIDVMIGFKLKSTIEKQSKKNKYVYQLFYTIGTIGYFLLFSVGPLVGPIGILFLITSALHSWNKKRNDNK